MRYASHYTVTTYSGPNTQFCSNNATLVPTSLCTSMSIGSFSVDCMGINGTQEDVYTTLQAEGASSRTELPPAESSTTTSTSDLSTETVATKSSSRQSIATLVPAPETHLTASSSLPATPTSTTSSLLEDPHSSPSSSNTPTPSSSSCFSLMAPLLHHPHQHLHPRHLPPPRKQTPHRDLREHTHAPSARDHDA